MKQNATPYQQVIYNALDKLIKQEKKNDPKNKKRLLNTLKNYKTLDQLEAKDKFYQTPQFYGFLAYIAAIGFGFLGFFCKEFFWAAVIWLTYCVLLIIPALCVYWINKNRDELLEFCKNPCNMYQTNTTKPSVADPFLFEAVQRWIVQDFSLGSICDKFLQQTNSIFELRVYQPIWKIKYDNTASPKSKALTFDFYDYLEKNGFHFTDLGYPKTSVSTAGLMKQVDAITMQVFEELQKHIQEDFKANVLQEPEVKSLLSEYKALENLDELQHIKWAWNKHFKHHDDIKQLDSLVVKCRLYFYFQEKVKQCTASYIINQGYTKVIS
ncbi:MAG: hypothetical protein ACPGC9_00700 [Cytophagales bacterium]